MTLDPKRFGSRLKELREKAGLSQKDLAEKAGLSQRAISHWEQGLREPGWSNVLALTEALGLDCRAFTEPPADRPEPKRGRPPKAPAAEPDPGAAKARRGRGKKAT